MKLQRIDAEGFEQLAGATELGAEARRMARMVLVEGKSHTDVADALGTSRQRVHLAVESVRRVHAARGGLLGLVSLDEPVPAALAAELGEFSLAYGQAKPAAAAKAAEEVRQAVRQAAASLLPTGSKAKRAGT